jgi:hypothetical protein
MKKRLWLALGVLAAVCLLTAIGPRALAWTQFRSGNAATVAKGEVVDNTVFMGGRNVDIAGTVNGDVICGAQNLNISGTVTGDVICGAQTINISGHVEGNIRIGGQTVNFNGTVDKNATIGAQTINTDSKSMVGGDADFAGSNLNLSGNIGRDLAVAGSNVNLSGEVGRDIKSAVQDMTIAGGAKVGGGIDYTSKNKVNISGGATVAGSVTQHIPKEKTRSYPRMAFFSGIFVLILGAVLLIAALILTALFPQFVHSVSSQAVKRPLRVFLTGFVASIVVPVVAVLLMISVIGIPLAILLILTWILIALTSGLFTAYYIGRSVWRRQHNPLLIVLAGGLLLLILFIIPFLGCVVMLFSFWIGAGMVLLELRNHIPRPKYDLK